MFFVQFQLHAKTTNLVILTITLKRLKKYFYAMSAFQAYYFLNYHLNAINVLSNGGLEMKNFNKELVLLKKYFRKQN